MSKLNSFFERPSSSVPGKGGEDDEAVNQSSEIINKVFIWISRYVLMDTQMCKTPDAPLLKARGKIFVDHFNNGVRFLATIIHLFASTIRLDYRVLLEFNTSVH